tara:strand:- start:377 stop:1285 length:909 start_codon:yes stop_codon:yes gene_type:complete
MKYFLVLLALLIAIVPVSAANSVTDIMENLDEYYYLVLAENAIGGDTLAASDIVLGIQQTNGFAIETVLEGEISENLPMIYIGPCGSEYLDEVLEFACIDWPYEEGQALIKVDGNNLIVTGTTPNDRRRAGMILKDYINYPELDQYSFLLITGMTLTPVGLEIEKAKTPDEFICGDGICEPGEAFLCFPDCNKKSCFDICQEQGYVKAFCREIPSNPNVQICQEGEANKGMQYCTEGKSCCCELAEEDSEEPPLKEPPAEMPPQEEVSFLSKLLEEISAQNIVQFLLIGLVIILIIWYILTR